ncbi:MAG: aminoglycoside phosphotransferase family protein [Candidatus Dormiibacterota bacterium]
MVSVLVIRFPTGQKRLHRIVTVQHAEVIAEDLLRRRPDSCERFLPRAGGTDSCNFRLSVGSERMLLTVKRRPNSPVGMYFHGRLQAARLPVPEAVAFGARAGPHGEACAIWEWIDGTPAEWGGGEPCPYDEAEFGQLLRRVHSLRFDGPFGFLGDDPQQRTFSIPGLTPSSAEWASVFDCEGAARHYLARGYLDSAEARLLASLPVRLEDELDCTSPRLLHMGDIMHTGNLLIAPDSGHIRAVLDYSESMAGDPRWELAWVRFYFADCAGTSPTFDLARFWAGYGAEYGAEDPLGRFYLAAILLFEKLRFYDPNTPRGRWAIATVRHILRSFA